MAKILVPSNECWYDELNTIAYYYEAVYERLIKQHISNIFPDFYAFNFKYAIGSPGRKDRKPDMALLKKDLSEWWLVEVELGSHPISHVRKQVDVFTNPEYNSYLIRNYIIKNVQLELGFRLNKAKIFDLVSNDNPKVLVLVDDEKTSWVNEISELGALVCIFEVYKNTDGEHAYRIDGKYPIIIVEESHCRYHPSLRNLLEIINPKVLDLRRNQFEIFYKGKLTNWSLHKSAKKIYLQFVGDFIDLPSDINYVLYKDNKNNLIIKRN